LHQNGQRGILRWFSLTRYTLSFRSLSKLTFGKSIQIKPIFTNVTFLLVSLHFLFCGDYINYNKNMLKRKRDAHEDVHEEKCLLTWSVTQTTGLPELAVRRIILAYYGEKIKIKTLEEPPQQAWLCDSQCGNFLEILSCKGTFNTEELEEFSFPDDKLCFSLEGQGPEINCSGKDKERGSIDGTNGKCCGYAFFNTRGQVWVFRLAVYAVNELTSCDFESIQGFSLWEKSVSYCESRIIYGCLQFLCSLL
jgi:hypothetical protein